MKLLELFSRIKPDIAMEGFKPNRFHSG